MCDDDREARGPRLGVIMAGGKATRLGPLTTTMSKALITVGSRPQVVNQIIKLRDAGCSPIVVVTSDRTDEQVADVIKYAGLSGIARTVRQGGVSGPVGALTTLIEEVDLALCEDVVIIMSDTVIGEITTTPGESWVGVSVAPTYDRSWCWYNGTQFVDDVAPDETLVAMGAYYFHDATLFQEALFSTPVRVFEDEVPMSAFLNAYPSELAHKVFTDWRDVGDVMALIHAKTGDGMITRAHHSLTVRDGVVTKRNVSPLEAQYMGALRDATTAECALFPQVFHAGRADYSMEYIDLPTLGELWMYWPIVPTVWAGIIEHVIGRIKATPMWVGEYDDSAGAWLADKVWNRHPQGLPDGITNDMVTALEDVVGISPMTMRGHGDLNFNNILFSPTSGVVKLIDPRGGQVPLVYEYAKLAYSPTFVAITHGLLGPNLVRDEPTAAVMSVLHRYVDERVLKAAMALTMMAAPPLHDERERPMMYEAARVWAEEALA